MVHLDMPEIEARRLLRLLESHERADRFPVTAKQLRRALVPLTPSGLAVESSGDWTARREERSSQADGPRIGPDPPGATLGRDRGAAKAAHES